MFKRVCAYNPLGFFLLRLVLLGPSHLHFTYPETKEKRKKFQRCKWPVHFIFLAGLPISSPLSCYRNKQ